MRNHRVIDQLEKLLDIGIALSSEMDPDLLLEKILQGAKSITNADGGTIYKISDNTIVMDVVFSDSLHLHLRNAFYDLKMPKIPLYNEDDTPNLKNVVSYSYHQNKAVNIPDAYNDRTFDFSGTKEFDKQNNYISKSFLTIPMKNHEGDTIGMLQLINALDDLGNIVSFDAISQQVTENLASQAATVLTQQQLITDLEKTLESLIQLIATAIDDKSPYTGGHCRRVPEITMLLAEAAHNSTSDYLKDFKLTDADRYELKIASWLHDCGKITTPEYVVDKATKLETIFDRIDLVETRFEVAKRDAEINFLKQRLSTLEKGQQLDSDLEHQLQQELARLQDDFDFIKTANTGSEFMAPEDQARIKQIANKKWSFNQQQVSLLTEEEVKNLNVSRGTLTDEERQVINHHINLTISMLEKIPLPKHLKNVPEFAGGHHERMDGKGYPKGLTREQMSVQARAMAIADIFEALTAKDRPYKQAKPLSEALMILKNMKDNNHIDPDLYDVFIQEKVYMQYAKKFLDEAQIDVD